MSDTTVSSTPLSKAEKAAFSAIFRNTPLVALTDGGMARSATHPQSVEDVRRQLESIVDYLRYAMIAHETAKDDLDDLNRDLKAVGRVLSKMGITNA